LVPRLRALYLVLVAVGVFFVSSPALVGAIAGAQLALLLATGTSPADAARILRKLFLFLAVIVIAYSLVEGDPGTADWRRLEILWWELEINRAGALVGLTMILRVMAVVFASHVARAGDPRALAGGLAQIGVPKKAALAIDATLVLLGDAPRGGGKGRGGGGGGGNRRGRLSRFWRRLRRLGSGDVSALTEPLARHIDRVEAHVAATSPELTARVARDVAVIAGVSLTMLGVKMLKLLPGLPFAPGHKGVLLIPLYFAAAALARTRFAGTLTGLTMGTAAFLLGDGRWGVFEIAKHVAPGLLVDLLMPVFIRDPRRAGIVAWCALGTVCALGRFATVTAIALTVQAPALVFAFLIPGLVIHGVFGALSGIVTMPLVRSLLSQRAADETEPREES
jgi:hypothetical protein